MGTYTHANNEPEKKIRTASVEPEKLNLPPRTPGTICEREKMSDKRRVPGLQPICLGQQLKNGQRKKTIPALKPLSRTDDAKIELKIDMVSWRREIEKQKLTRIKKVKIKKQQEAGTTTTSTTSVINTTEQSKFIFENS